MSVDREEVERIARLARLRFDDGEVERLTKELNGILEHVEALRALTGAASVEGEPPSESRPSTRSAAAGEPDVLETGPERMAPRWVDGFFVVPPPPGVLAEEGEG